MHGFMNRGLIVPRGRFAEPGRFGRLFSELRTLREKDLKIKPAEMGRLGGPMDGGNPPPTDTTQNNPRIKAGYTFLGQFIDHDLTLDTTSVLQQQIDVEGTKNFRTPVLELDSLYGLGPDAQPSLYDREEPGHLLLSPDGKDLPRNTQGRALIGDPRNDENRIISQLHTLFIKFHNKVYDDHTDPSQSSSDRFQAAQKLVRWHYQWIVVNEFLPRTIGNTTVKRLLKSNLLCFPDGPFMPVEFSVAAYRFGHSQVRPGYAIAPGVGAALFPDNPEAAPNDTDLRGGRPLPPGLVIDWSLFFGEAAQPGKRVDTKISSVLIRLPDSVVPPGTPDAHRSLATRNLQRGLDAQLPSGQDVAYRLALPDPLTEAQIWSGVPGGEGPAPLWYYCLKEGEVRTQGLRLAGVGAEIVGRVMLGVLMADHASYLFQHPLWKPTLPAGHAGRFTMSDLTNLALGTTINSEDVTRLPGDARDDD